MIQGVPLFMLTHFRSQSCNLVSLLNFYSIWPAQIRRYKDKICSFNCYIQSKRYVAYVAIVGYSGAAILVLAGTAGAGWMAPLASTRISAKLQRVQ